MNIGEELTGAYLKHIYHCNFVEYNVKDSAVNNGEIDVVGIDISNKKIYFCEVAIHLTTGLQYKSDKAANTQKIYNKFIRAKEYAEQMYPEYIHIFQIWSPLVKKSQMQSLQDAVKKLKDEKIDLALKTNKDYAEAINKLKDYAQKQTSALENPAMRILQILGQLEKIKQKY